MPARLLFLFLWNLSVRKDLVLKITPLFLLSLLRSQRPKESIEPHIAGSASYLPGLELAGPGFCSSPRAGAGVLGKAALAGWRAQNEKREGAVPECGSIDSALPKGTL